MVRERLPQVLGQIGSELCFPWQQIAPIWLLWEKWRHHVFSKVFDWILFILEGNDDIHKSLTEFEIQPDPTNDDIARAWMSLKFGQIRLMVSMVTDRIITEITVLPLILGRFLFDPFHTCR